MLRTTFVATVCLYVAIFIFGTDSKRLIVCAAFQTVGQQICEKFGHTGYRCPVKAFGERNFQDARPEKKEMQLSLCCSTVAPAPKFYKLVLLHARWSC